MKKSYTQQDIEKIFRDFGSFRNPYTIEKVHQLLNNPDARARHSVKLNSKPFNFIIMTSVIVIGLSVLLFWSNPKKSDVELTALKKSDAVAVVMNDPITSSEKNPDFNQTASKSPIINEPEKASKVAIDPGLSIGNPDLAKDGNVIAKTEERQEVPLLSIKEYVRNAKLSLDTETCTWSSDTIIDKHFLLLNLTDPEMKKIGIARNGSAMFYHNIIKGKYNLAYYDHRNLFSAEDTAATFNSFFVANITNLNFEPHGSADFYSSMDTLVPVVINDKAGILWFAPDEKFFSLLPERYSYLSSVFKNLVCLKKKFPARTFTNYLENGKERILDAVNVLNLAKANLQKIGIIIDDGSVIFQTIYKHYSLKICESGTYSIGNDEDSNVFPPNPYPVAMTDTLGRQIYIEGTNFRQDSVSKFLNILVPVRINIHDFVSSYKQVIICWYYPTDDFLKALPGNIGPDLKSELLIVKNGTQTSASSCNYFEVCKSSLKLNDFKLYPNPARNSVTVEFQNSEEIIGSISIVNMAGLKLRELLPNTSFLSGRNSYNLDLSGISSGIYLISVNTQKGFKTGRLIVSR